MSLRELEMARRYCLRCAGGVGRAKACPRRNCELWGHREGKDIDRTRRLEAKKGKPEGASFELAKLTRGK